MSTSQSNSVDREAYIMRALEALRRVGFGPAARLRLNCPVSSEMYDGIARDLVATLALNTPWVPV